MTNTFFKYTCIAVLLLILQTLLLDHIQIGGYLNSYLYVLLILLLPFETPKLLLISTGFTYGLVIDIFSNTLGMHAAATTLMAFLRPTVIRFISARDNNEISALPRLHQMGVGWFLKYTIILVLAHHIYLFFIEVFTVTDFYYTLLRGLISSAFTITLVIISQLLAYKNQKSG